MINTDYIHKDAETGLEYIQGKGRVLFENGVLLTVDEVARNKGAIGNIIREYRLDPAHSGYDYAYAKTTGIIRKKAFHPKGPIQQKAEIKQVTPMDEPVEKLQKTEEKPVENVKSVVKEYLTTATIIMTIMTIVGILSAFMSAYHTAGALQIMGRTPFMGWVTGTVMILFSATAFTAARFFIHEHGIARIFGALFGILGVVIIIYSMFSTLTVNFTNYKKVSDQQTVEVAKNSSTVNAYESKKGILEKKLQAYENDLERLNKDAEYWKTMSWKRHDEIQEQIKEIRQKKETVEDELINLQMEIPDVEAKAEESVDTIYTFFARLTHINVEWLQFFIQSVPAMFFDIIAPFALSCVFYLKDKRKEE